MDEQDIANNTIFYKISVDFAKLMEAGMSLVYLLVEHSSAETPSPCKD